jgi:hypothetical protein
VTLRRTLMSSAIRHLLHWDDKFSKYKIYRLYLYSIGNQMTFLKNLKILFQFQILSYFQLYEVRCFMHLQFGQKIS